MTNSLSNILALMLVTFENATVLFPMVSAGAILSSLAAEWYSRKSLK